MERHGALRATRFHAPGRNRLRRHTQLSSPETVFFSEGGALGGVTVNLEGHRPFGVTARGHGDDPRTRAVCETHAEALQSGQACVRGLVLKATQAQPETPEKPPRGVLAALTPRHPHQRAPAMLGASRFPGPRLHAAFFLFQRQGSTSAPPDGQDSRTELQLPCALSLPPKVNSE